MCKNVTQPLTHRGQAAAQNQSGEFKKRFKHVSSLAFFQLFSAHFCCFSCAAVVLVAVAFPNLRPKDTISIWGACEILTPIYPAPHLACTLSLSALWHGALISAWMQSKRFPFGPRERLPSLVACMLTCLDLDLAKRGTRQRTLPYISENGHGATFSTWLIFTI